MRPVSPVGRELSIASGGKTRGFRHRHEVVRKTKGSPSKSTTARRELRQAPIVARSIERHVGGEVARANMDRIDEIVERRHVAHAKLTKSGSKVFKAFLAMEEAAFSEGALSTSVKELIAVGISVVIDCESCMQWHLDQSAKAGATREQAMEAIEVGIEMGGGPATVSARFALEVMDRLFPE